MKLTQQQLFVQEKILLAVHWETIEEARAKEAKLRWCEIETRDNKVRNVSRYDEETWVYRDWNWDWFDSGDFWIGQLSGREAVIWLPPTLPRVLTTLWVDYGWKEWYLHAIVMYNVPINWEKAQFIQIPRQLLNSDWTDATLRQQTEETQEAIAKLLWREE